MELFTLHAAGKNHHPVVIEASEEDYEYFARSELARIGSSRNRKLFIAGEKAVLPVVELSPGIRRSLIAATNEELLRWLESNRSKIGMKTGPRLDSRRVEILFSLRDGLKNARTKFLQRIPG